MWPVSARAAHLFGMHFVLACPQDYAFTAADIAGFGDAWGTSITQVHDPEASCCWSRCSLYRCVDEHGAGGGTRDKRPSDFVGYQINAELPQATGTDTKILALLASAHRGEEISAEAFEGPQSFVFDQQKTVCMHRRHNALFMADEPRSCRRSGRGEFCGNRYSQRAHDYDS